MGMKNRGGFFAPAIDCDADCFDRCLAPGYSMPNAPTAVSSGRPWVSSGLPKSMNSPIIQDILQEKQILRIEVTDECLSWIGALLPITPSMLSDVEMIEKLTQWRNRAQKYFATQFQATIERTRGWLDRTVLADPDRLLFLVMTPNRLVGHMGFKGLSDQSVELDNFIRGEMGGHPQLIYHSEIALLRWLFRIFPIQNVYASVFADNFVTLNLHHSVGFRLTERIPLRRKMVGEEIHLEMGRPGDPSPEGRYSHKLELRRSEFNPLMEEIHG
jgi:RimJ/RimL family protein N-acetyltransferase